MTTTLLHSILARVPLIHLAHDADCSSVTLTGVLLQCTAGTLTIVATNGKLLIEEQFAVQGVADFTALVSEDGVKRLASFLKLTVNKKMDTEVTASVDSKAMTLTASNGSAVVLPLLSGTFPAFAAVWDKPKAAVAPVRFCTNGDYVAILAKVWSRGKAGGPAIVYEWRLGHLRCTPLVSTCEATVQRAILMPVILPE